MWVLPRPVVKVIVQLIPSLLLLLLASHLETGAITLPLSFVVPCLGTKLPSIDYFLSWSSFAAMVMAVMVLICGEALFREELLGFVFVFLFPRSSIDGL